MLFRVVLVVIAVVIVMWMAGVLIRRLRGGRL
jgi:hypothetical protein